MSPPALHTIEVNHGTTWAVEAIVRMISSVYANEHPGYIRHRESRKSQGQTQSFGVTCTKQACLNEDVKTLYFYLYLYSHGISHTQQQSHIAINTMQSQG